MYILHLFNKCTKYTFEILEPQISVRLTLNPIYNNVRMRVHYTAKKKKNICNTIC